MTKTKKFFVVIILLCFIFVNTADAILWLLAGVVRAGVVRAAAFISTPIGQSVVRSAVNHVLVGGAAYLYLNRGDSVPPAEKYIQVSLTSTKTAVQTMKDEGKILASSTPSGGWSYSYSLYDTGVAPERDTWIKPVADGSLACRHVRVITNGQETSLYWDGGYTYGPEHYSHENVQNGTFSSALPCDASEKTVWVGSDSQKDIAAAAVMADSHMRGEAVAAIGEDLIRSAFLVSAPVAGEPVIDIGADGSTKEFASDAPESDITSWINNTNIATSGMSAGATAADIGAAVGSAVNSTITTVKTSVDAVKTSTDAVKTSTDAVKTSVDGVKTSVDGVKASTDGVKASVDAVNTKLGTNPGNATAPSYDSDYTNPTENNISDRLGSFISSNPIIGAISGSHLSLSGAVCSATVGAAFGKPLTLNFCWMESYLIMFGNVMVIFAGLTAAFIIFRRGD